MSDKIPLMKMQCGCSLLTSRAKWFSRISPCRSTSRSLQKSNMNNEIRKARGFFKPTFQSSPGASGCGGLNKGSGKRFGKGKGKNKGKHKHRLKFGVINIASGVASPK